MNKIFLLLPIVFLLLIGNVNASVSVISGFKDGGSVKDINDGDKAAFWIDIWSDTGSESVDVSLRDLNNNLVHTFEDYTVSRDGFAKEYLIDKTVYKNPGKYKIIVYAKDSESDVLDDSLRLNVKEKVQQPINPSNNAPKLIIKKDNTVINYEVTTEKGKEIVLVLEGIDEDKDDKLTYGYRGGVPSGSSLVNNVFRWTPEKSDSIGTIIEFSVTDGNSVEFKVIKIIVKEMENQTQPPASQDSNIVRGDFDYDGIVGLDDFFLFSEQFGKDVTQNNAEFDLNKDGKINLEDFFIISNNFGKSTGLSVQFLDVNGNKIDSLTVQENKAFSLVVDPRDKIGTKLQFSFQSDLSALKNNNRIEGGTTYDTVRHPEIEKTFNIKITASDGVNKIVKIIPLIVKDVNRNPIIRSVERIEPIGLVREGHTIKIRVDAVDSDGDSLEYSVNKGKFTADGNILVWKTGFDDSGFYEFTVHAKDFFGGSSTDSSLKFWISDAIPLVFTSTPLTEFALDKIGKEYVYDANTNKDNGFVGGYPIYSLVTGPKGMSIDSKTGVVKWKPESNQDGDYIIKIRAVDWDDIDGFQEFNLKVVKPANKAPQLSVKKDGNLITSVNVLENSELMLDLAAVDPDSDIYPGTIVFRLENIPEGMKLENNKILYKPDYNIVQHPAKEKQFEIKIIASDGVSETKLDFKVVVTDVNRLPALTVPDSAIRIEESRSIGAYVGAELRGNTIIFDVVNENDPDNDSVIISVDNLPKGARIENNKFIWKIRRNQGTIREIGQPEIPYELVFKLSDGISSVEKKIKIFISDNTLPFYPGLFNQLTPPEVMLNVISIEPLQEGIKVVATGRYNSIDKQNFNDELEYNFDWGDGVITGFKKNIEESTATHFYKYDMKFGTPKLKLQVKDEDGMIGEASYNFDFRNAIILKEAGQPIIISQPVQPTQPSGTQPGTTTPTPTPTPGVNQAPVVSSIPDQTITAGQNFNDVNLDSFVADPDNADNQIIWSVTGAVNLAVNIDANRIARVSYPNNFAGAETLVFTARDPSGAGGSDNAVFTVNAAAQIVNNNPVLNVKRSGFVIGNQLTINEGESLVLNLEGSDIDNDQLRFEASGLPAGAVFNNNMFNWIPTNVQGGKNYVVTFRVFDLDSNGQVKGGSDTETVVITVNDNLEPFFKKAAKLNRHNLNIKNMIINNWQTVERGEIFNIDIIADNKGNVKEDNVKITVQMPQIDYYQRSDKFDIRKKRSETRSFTAIVPENINDEVVYAIVTASSDNDEVTKVIGFLVE